MNARLEKIRSKADEGFTLIEMLVVVMIMGILAAVGTVGVAQYQLNANVTACGTQQSTIYNAGNAYLLENDAVSFAAVEVGWTTSTLILAGLQTDGYLATFPAIVDVQFGTLAPIVLADDGGVTGC